MNREEIRVVILALLKRIAPETSPQNLKPHASIRKTLDIDSFDFLRFIIALDKNFGIQTPEADYDQLEDMEGVLTYIEGCLTGKHT